MHTPGERTSVRELSILIYHRVRPVPDALFPEDIDRDRFERQMKQVTRIFNVLGLGEAVKRISDGSLPPRAACVTFDDGYADNEQVALPILSKYGVRATFFVASGYLDGGRMFNDTVIESVRLARGDILDLRDSGLGLYDIASTSSRRDAIDSLLHELKYMSFQARAAQAEEIRKKLLVDLPTDLMMTKAQVRSLYSAGMEIGGHTVMHPILKGLDRSTARTEIYLGRTQLEEIIQAPVKLFAYPNGKPNKDYDAEQVALVRELGFSAAVSTAPGVAIAGCDIHQLPRFTPWDTGSLKFVLRLLQNTFRRRPEYATQAPEQTEIRS